MITRVTHQDTSELFMHHQIAWEHKLARSRPTRSPRVEEGTIEGKDLNAVVAIIGDVNLILVNGDAFGKLELAVFFATGSPLVRTLAASGKYEDAVVVGVGNKQLILVHCDTSRKCELASVFGRFSRLFAVEDLNVSITRVCHIQ